MLFVTNTHATISSKRVWRSHTYYIHIHTIYIYIYIPHTIGYIYIYISHKPSDRLCYLLPILTLLSPANESGDHIHTTYTYTLYIYIYIPHTIGYIYIYIPHTIGSLMLFVTNTHATISSKRVWRSHTYYIHIHTLYIYIYPTHHRIYIYI